MNVSRTLVTEILGILCVAVSTVYAQEITVDCSRTDEKFVNRYQAAAKKIKRHYPHLKVGGPSVGGGFEFKENGWQGERLPKRGSVFVQNDLKIATESCNSGMGFG